MIWNFCSPVWFQGNLTLWFCKNYSNLIISVCQNNFCIQGSKMITEVLNPWLVDAGHQKRFWVPLRWVETCSEGEIEKVEPWNSKFILAQLALWLWCLEPKPCPVIYSYHVEPHIFSWLPLVTQTLASLFKSSRKELHMLHSPSLNSLLQHRYRLWDSAPALPGLGPNSLRIAALIVLVLKFHSRQTAAAFSRGIMMEQILPTFPAICFWLRWLQS